MITGHVNYLLSWVRHFKADKPVIAVKKPIDKYFLKSHILMDELRIKQIISDQNLSNEHD